MADEQDDPGLRRRLSSVRPLPEKKALAGWAEKQGGPFKAWRKRYFVLNDRVLRYSAKPEDARPKGIIVVANILKVVPVTRPSASFGMDIVTRQKTYPLRFPDMATRDLWVASIQSHIPKEGAAKQVQQFHAAAQQHAQQQQQQAQQHAQQQQQQAQQQMLQQQQQVAGGQRMQGAQNQMQQQLQQAQQMLAGLFGGGQQQQGQGQGQGLPQQAQQLLAGLFKGQQGKGGQQPAVVQPHQLQQLMQQQGQRPQQQQQQQQAAVPREEMDTSMLLVKSRNFGPYIPWTTCGIEEEVMQTLDSIFANTNLTIVTGPPGSGKSTVVRETFECLRQCHAPHGMAPLQNFRTIGLMVCDKCQHVRLLPEERTEEELLTIYMTNGRKARTKSGSCTVTTGEEPCSECEGHYKLEWITMAADECDLLPSVHSKSPDVTSVAFIRCSNCSIAGVPMTPEGLCTYSEVDGSIIAVTGQPMPQAQDPAWRFSLPHFGDQQCQSADMDVISANLSAETSQALAARKETATSPSRYRPGFGYYLEIVDLGLASKAFRSTLRDLGVALGSKAHRILFSQDLKPSQILDMDHSTLMQSWDHYASQVATRANNNVAYFLPRFEHGRISPDELASLLTSGSTFRVAKFIVTMNEERAEEYASACRSKGVSVNVVHTRPKEEAVMAEMLELYLDGVLAFARPDAGETQERSGAAGATKGHLISHREVGQRLAKALAGKSVLVHVVAANYVRILQEFYPERVEAVLDAPPTDVDSAVAVLLDTVAETYGEELVEELSFAAASTSSYTIDFIVEFCEDSKSTVTRQEVRRIVQTLGGVLAQPRTASSGGYFPPNTRVKEAALKWVRQRGTPNSFKEYCLRLAKSARRELGVTRLVGLVSAVFEPLFTVGAFDMGLSLFRDWELIHRCLVFGEITPVRRAKQELTQHYSQKEFFSQEILDDLEMRMAFIEKNAVPLCDKETWSVVQTQFRALRHGDAMQAIMKGHFDPAVRPPSRLVRIFTSSTFDDLKVERNALMARSYPVIRSELAEIGLDFQVVDMRWGIRDESTADHKTSEICMEEIRLSQEQSLGPNFVTLLSQRYGYRPFPVYIEQKELDALIGACEQKDKDLLLKWFDLDTNKVPATYRLLPVTHHLPHFISWEDPEQRRKERAQWWSEFEQMCEALRKAADKVFAHDESTRHKYYFSITEEEIIRGVLSVDPKLRESQCLWVKRTIEDLDEVAAGGDDERIRAFTDMVSPDKPDEDARELLAHLRQRRLPKALPQHSVLEYNVKYAKNKGIDEEDPVHKQYIDSLVKEFTSKLISMVEQNKQVANTKLAADPNIAEVVIHNERREELSNSFFGRRALLERVAERMDPKHPATVPLVLAGVEGSGKSALLAKVASTLNNGTSAVVTRFLGRSSQSTNVNDVMRSLAFQIASAYKQDITFPETIEDLKKEFRRLLSLPTPQQPLILLLDGIDRLNTAGGSLDLGLWLPAQLPPHVKVLLTVSSHAPGAWFGCHALVGKDAAHFWEVPNLESEDIGPIIDGVLKQENRALTPEQREILEVACKQNLNALYVHMAVQVTRDWKSSTKSPSLPLTSSGILNGLLDSLEVTHGHFLVKHALSYITLSFEGLTSPELEDLLSLDDEVLNDVFQYWEPPLRRIPPLLIVRLLRDLSRYMTTAASSTGHPCHRWAFGSFANVVVKRYFSVDLHSDLLTLSIVDDKWKEQEEKAKLRKRADWQTLLLNSEATKEEAVFHARMADYFAGRWHNKEKPYKSKNGDKNAADRLVAEMPVNFRKEVLPDGTFALPNSRRALELPFHLYRPRDMESLLDAWADPESINFYAPSLSNEVNTHLIPLANLYTTAVGIKRVAERCRKLLDAMIGELEEESDPLDVRRAYACLVGLENMLSFFSAPTDRKWSGPHYERLAHLLDKVNTHNQDTIKFSTKLDEAEELLQQGRAQEGLTMANGVLQKLQTDESLGSVRTILRISRIFLTAGAAGPAMNALQRAYDVSFSAGESEEAAKLQAEVLKTMSNFHRSTGNLAQAKQLAAQGLDLCKARFGDSHLETAIAHHNLGSMCFDLGDLANAETHLKEARTLKAASLGAHHYDNASTLAALAAVYMTQAQMNPAVNHDKKISETLKEALSLCDSEDLTTGDAIETRQSVLNQMAHFHASRGNVDEAVACMDKAIESCQATQADQQRKGSLIMNKGIFYMNQQRFLEALPIELEAHKVLESSVGKDHPEVGKAAECVAICLQQCGKLQDSVPYVEQVKRISQGAGSMFH